MNWKWMLVLVLLLFLVIFAVQNYEVVNVRFLLWSFTTSRAIVIFASVVLGIVIGAVIAYINKRY